MSYTYKVELNFADGAGWLVVDNYHIIAESIKRKMCFHNNLEPNSNSLTIQLSRDFTVGSKRLIDYLLTTKDDIQIRVTRTSDGSTYKPYFVGFISDNFKVAVSHTGIDVVELKCEDGTNKLLKRPYTQNKNLVSKKVCDTSNFNQSILYQAFRTASDASYVPLDLTSLPNITNTIPVVIFSNYEDKTTYDYLKAILYEYGYTFFFNASGEVVVKSYKPIISPEPTIGFFNTASSRNIYGRIEIEKNRAAYKDVTIKFQTLKTLNDVVVFTDTTGGDSISKCNIEVKAGLYYPEGADAEVNVYSEYKLETGEAILSVGDITLDVEKDSQITQVTATNLYKRANLKFRNDGASSYYIKKLDIKGTSVICEDTYNKTTALGTYSKDKMLEYEASIIHTKSESEYLATTLYNYYQNANIKYKLKSKDVFDVGDVVKLKEDAQSGIDTIGQIIEIEDSAASDLIQYTLIGASTVEVTPPLSTEWLNASPTINNTIPDQVTEQDIQDAIDAVNTVSSQQATYFSEGKGIIIPMDIYPEGGIAEPNYAKLLELADKYSSLNLYVLVNPQLGTPHIDEWNNFPLTRPRQYYEWQNWIAVIKAMKAKKIKIVIYANSTTDIDNLLSYFNTANGCTLSGIYIPEQSAGIYYSYTPSLNTTLKAITDYAHAKSLYPVFAYASDHVHKTYFANGAADVFVYDAGTLQTAESECVAYDTATNGLALYKALVNKAYSANQAFSPSLYKTQFEYFNMVFHQPSNLLVKNGGRKLESGIVQKTECTFKLIGGRAPYTYIDGYINGNPIYNTLIYSQSFQTKSSCKFDLSVQPPQTSSYFGKLPDELETEMRLLSGSMSWQDVIDAASAATPRTPEIISASFAGSAELSWEYQTDLGPALKYYEILISKDHDPDNSDPDNGTWWKPKNDGTNWRYDDDTDPLQLTTESYSFVAPLDLDTDDMPVESVYFFKVRRVSAKSNSGWGYASAALRPISTVEIGKDTISAPMIRAGSITADKIATASITASHIASVDGGAIKTGNIQSETYQQGSAGWKLAMSGSAEFNDVTVRGTVYATDGTFSGSINSGPLMLNKNPPSTTSTTITSGGNAVDWIRALQSSASIVAGSFNCSGTYNGTALGRLELAQTQESPAYEYWQKTGTHQESGSYWGITGYTPVDVWYDQWGWPHVSGGQPTYGWINYTSTVEDDVKWTRTTTKYTYTLKLYSSSSTLLCTYTDWYETAGSWTNSGVTSTGLNASTSAPSAASATQGTVTFSASGSVSFTANAFTYRLLNLPQGYDSAYPSGTVYLDIIDANTAYLKVRR